MKILKSIALFSMILLISHSTLSAKGVKTTRQLEKAVTEKVQTAYDIYSKNSNAAGSVHVIFRINESGQVEVLNVYGGNSPQLWGLTKVALEGETIEVSDDLAGKNLKIKVTFENN